MLGVWDDHDYGMNAGGKVCSNTSNQGLFLFKVLECFIDQINVLNKFGFSLINLSVNKSTFLCIRLSVSGANP